MKNKTQQKKHSRLSIKLGGADGERLYLKDLEFRQGNSDVQVKKTKEPGVDMKDLIARHKGRYGLVALFSRPGFRVLDFPCGSGYAAAFLKEFGVKYEGMDLENSTINYAKKVYGKDGIFKVGDLCSPSLKKEYYDVVACIEGLEHVDNQSQKRLLASLYTSLKSGGIMIISSPENKSGISGPSKLNPFHKWELTKDDFKQMLFDFFGDKNVELITHKAILSPGLVEMICFYAVCHKK